MGRKFVFILRLLLISSYPRNPFFIRIPLNHLVIVSNPFDLPGFIDSLKYHENEKEITYSYPCDCNQYCYFLLCFRGSNLKGRLPSDPGICRIRKSLNITDPTIFEVTNFGNLFDLY